MLKQLKRDLKNLLTSSEEDLSKDIGNILQFIENMQFQHGAIKMDTSCLTQDSPYVHFLNFLPDPAFIINSEGVVVAWNPALEKFSGIAAKSVIGKGNFEHIKILHGKRTPGLIDMVNGCDEIGEIDYTAISRRGNALAAEITLENIGNRKKTNIWIQSAPIFNEEEKTIGAIESLRDISARKQTENINHILYKISAALNSTTKTAEFLKQVHESLNQFIEADNFFVALYNEKENSIKFPYYKDAENYISPNEVFDLSKRATLSEKVIKKEKPILIDQDFFHQNNQDEHPLIGSTPKSWLGVPLKIKDKILGVMTIQSYLQRNAYNNQDIDMMVAISEQVAAALMRSQAESALLESEKKFRSVFENATVAIFQFSKSGELLIANPAMAKIMGYSSVDEMLADKKCILNYVYDSSSLFKLLRKVIQYGYVNGMHMRVKHREGFETWVTVNARTYYDEDGCPVLYTGSAFDSTNEVIAERKIIHHKSRFMQLFESSPQAIVLTDSTGAVVDTNKAFTELFNYTSEQMSPCCENLCPEGNEKGLVKQNLKKILAGETFRGEGLRRAADGSLIPVSILGYPFVYNEEIVGTFIIYDDISHRKEYERKLSYQSLHDSLTGLPNRSFFLKRLDQALRTSQTTPSHNFAVLMLDIDMFKRINDSLGHKAGDKMLIEVGKRIMKCVRNSDTVARMGGDEFAVLIDNFSTPQRVIQTIRDIRNEIGIPVEIASKKIVISSSIGIVFKTSSYEHPEHIVRDADISMYKAKELGVNKFKVFNKSMHEKALQSLLVETEIRQGIPEKEFFPYFQPIYSLKSRRLAGFEALVRWNHPYRGFLTPNHIISIAEETGLIVEIDRLVLLEACYSLATWQEKYPETQDLFLTANLSPIQLSKPDLVESIEEILFATGISTRNIKLEITEDAIMERNTTTVQNIKKIEKLGIKLAVDDFGTGYSSLAQLQRFPASTVKIDRSFVNRMAEDHESLEIVRAVNALGHSLNMDVIAEGVETREQLLLLNEIGCDCVQGFYFDRPQCKEEAEKLVKMRSKGSHPPDLTSI